MAGTRNRRHTQKITHIIKNISTDREKKKKRPQDERLTDAGYEVMEDFLREEGLVQSSKIELQDTGDGVHVVIILVPCQRVLT